MYFFESFNSLSLKRGKFCEEFLQIIFEHFYV